MFTIGLYHFDTDVPPGYIEDSSGWGNHGEWVQGTPIYGTPPAGLCPP